MASSAHVKISMSPFNILVDGELQIKVDEISPKYPSPDFDGLRCGFCPNNSTRMDALAEYNKKTSMFEPPPEGLPSRFSLRIKFKVMNAFNITSVELEDKNGSFYCILDNYDGNEKKHDESVKYQLRNVYSKYY